MFLNKTMLKKLIKSSFKWEGLTVGRIYGGLVVAGGTWVIWTEDGYIPNWLKAAVMEYTGELPKRGCAFKAKKDEPIQYEIADNAWYDLPSMHQKAIYAYEVTPVVIKGKGERELRVLQQNGSSMQMLAVPENMYEVIDPRELGEENAPAGPASTLPAGGVLIYKNEHSAYAFSASDGMSDMAKRIIDSVGTIDFGKGER